MRRRETRRRSLWDLVLWVLVLVWDPVLDLEWDLVPEGDLDPDLEWDLDLVLPWIRRR